MFALLRIEAVVFSGRRTAAGSVASDGLRDDQLARELGLLQPLVARKQAGKTNLHRLTSKCGVFYPPGAQNGCSETGPRGPPKRPYLQFCTLKLGSTLPQVAASAEPPLNFQITNAKKHWALCRTCFFFAPKR